MESSHNYKINSVVCQTLTYLWKTEIEVCNNCEQLLEERIPFLNRVIRVTDEFCQSKWKL